MRVTTTTFLLSLLLLAGCYGPKKAAWQVNKAIAKQPVVAAEILRDKWPCVTKEIDSTAFKEARAKTQATIRSIDSIQALLNRQRLDAETLEQALDRLQLDSATKQTCKQLILFADQKQKENDRLMRTVSDLTAAYKTLQEQVLSTPPVVRQVEDSAKIFLAQAQTKEAELRLAKMESSRDNWKTFALALGCLLLLAGVFIFILIKRRR